MLNTAVKWRVDDSVENSCRNKQHRLALIPSWSKLVCSGLAGHPAYQHPKHNKCWFCRWPAYQRPKQNCRCPKKAFHEEWTNRNAAKSPGIKSLYINLHWQFRTCLSSPVNLLFWRYLFSLDSDDMLVYAVGFQAVMYSKFPFLAWLLTLVRVKTPVIK